MPWLTTFLYQAALIGSVTVPLLGLPGLEAALAASLVVTLAIAAFGEWCLMRAWREHIAAVPGLGRTADLAGLSSARISILSLPEADLRVARSWIGGGRIYITQGLLSVLSESELEAILKIAERLRARPVTVTRTLGAVHAVVLDFLLQWLGPKPTAFLARTVLESMASTLRIPVRAVEEEDFHLNSALRKLSIRFGRPCPISLVS